MPGWLPHARSANAEAEGFSGPETNTYSPPSFSLGVGVSAGRVEGYWILMGVSVVNSAVAMSIYPTWWPYRGCRNPLHSTIIIQSSFHVSRGRPRAQLNPKPKPLG
jgi:hypothetical protein